MVGQIEYSRPQPAQKFAPEAFYGWLEKQRALAERVVVCYEAGCFGYEPARRMQAMGVEVYVIAPQNWDEQGKRQVNDKHDALVICRRLSEYLAGHAKALSIVRIPSPEEEASTGAGAYARATMPADPADAGDGAQSSCCKGRWRCGGAGGAGEPGSRFSRRCRSWVIAQLEIWKGFLELAEKQVRHIEVQLKKAAPGQLLFGEGELTHELLARELIDPQRFRNARQVGNYFGLCPSESTSDQRRRMGSITKHGNPRLRRLMVESGLAGESTSSRHYRGVLRWGALLHDRKASAAARKKAIVGPRPASGRRPLADGHRARPGRRTRAGLKRDPADKPEKESLPIRKSFI